MKKLNSIGKNTLWWSGIFILGLIIALPLFTIINMFEISNTALEFYIPKIELSFEFPKFQFLENIFTNKLPVIADLALISLAAFGNFLLSTTIFLAQNFVFKAIATILAITLLAVFIISKYKSHQEKLFSITPDLNRVLESKRHLIHSEAKKIRKKGVSELFRDIFRIESFKNGSGDR